MANNQILQFKRSIHAPAAQVYRAFTQSMALREWMCERAHVTPCKGGRIYLEWSNGFFSLGEYKVLNPSKKIVFTWWGREEPSETLVQLSIHEREGHTTVKLLHSAIGSGRIWKKSVQQIVNGWEILLENLQSVLETGIDLRIARRPMLGIRFGELVTLADTKNMGILVADVMDGADAQSAGLSTGDVIVAVDRKKLSGHSTISDRLTQKRAGDKVRLTFERGGHIQTKTIELSPRQLPEIPPNPDALVLLVQELYSRNQAMLRRSIEDVPDALASVRPDRDHWNAKEILAHLIAIERDVLSWCASCVEGDDIENAHRGHLPSRILAITSVYGTPSALFDELVSTQAEVVELIRNLPPEFLLQRGAYWRLGYRTLSQGSHTEQHVRQIEAALEHARRQAQ